MKFWFWLTAFYLGSFSGQAQSLPDSFKIGELIEVSNGRNLKVYFSKSGNVKKAACADFFRTGSIARTQPGFNGPVQDFYPDGAKAFEGNMVANVLQGKATYYFENGNIAETGNYKDHSRDGVWKYFYPNGNLEKVINFIEKRPFVVTYLDSSQVVRVVNGNGSFTHKFIFNETGLSFTIAGELKDGQMHGEWAFVGSTGRELFDNGKFLKGYSDGNKNADNYSNYADSPRMKLSGYYPSENLRLDQSVYCPFPNLSKEKSKRIVISEQKPYRYNKGALTNTFYPELLQKLQNVLPPQAKDQWLLIGLEIEKTGNPTKIEVLSSEDDANLEKIVFAELSNMDKWEAARINKVKTTSSHYFAVQIQNGQVIIPAIPAYQAK